MYKGQPVLLRTVVFWILLQLNPPIFIWFVFWVGFAIDFIFSLSGIRVEKRGGCDE